MIMVEIDADDLTDKEIEDRIGAACREAFARLPGVTYTMIDADELVRLKAVDAAAREYAEAVRAVDEWELDHPNDPYPDGMLDRMFDGYGALWLCLTRHRRWCRRQQRRGKHDRLPRSPRLST